MRYVGGAPPARGLRAGIEAHVAKRNLRAPGESEPSGLSEEEIEQLDVPGYLAREREGGREISGESP